MCKQKLRQRKNNLSVTLQEKRNLAKTGMVVSMGALFLTSLMKGRGAKTLHLWSAISLLGFSFWHHSLYSHEK